MAYNFKKYDDDEGGGKARRAPLHCSRGHILSVITRRGGGNAWIAALVTALALLCVCVYALTRTGAATGTRVTRVGAREAARAEIEEGGQRAGLALASPVGPAAVLPRYPYAPVLSNTRAVSRAYARLRPGAWSATASSRSLVLVVSYMSEDVSWIPAFLPHIPVVLMCANTSGAAHQHPHMMTKEAGAFLGFILQYYDALPDLVTFVHAHRHAYHTYGKDMAALLARVRWDDIHGYTSLNLNEFHKWEPGYRNWDFIVENWDKYFSDIAPVKPTEAQAYCCAQFIVTKEEILARPREFYENLMEFVLNLPLYTSYDIPRVMEHLWHMIFHQPAIMETVDICSVIVCE